VTSLTSISGALALLAGGTLGELPAQAKAMLDIAHKNSQRLTQLVNNLLDLEKLADGRMQFDLQVQPLMPLVEQSLESMLILAEQREIDCRLVERADDVLVEVDGVRLQQILVNLLSNAIKFSPRNSVVELAVRKRQGAVRVEVIDQGPGIPQAFRPRIFQRFSQADASDSRQAEGSGLGLAISREIADGMGGILGFSSEEGKGACFHLELATIEAVGLPPAAGQTGKKARA
jgi:signal transduction histidine kinase